MDHVNRNQIQESIEKNSFIVSSKKPDFIEYLDELARYPETTICRDAK